MGWFELPIQATSYAFVTTMMGFPALITIAYTFSHLVHPRLRGAKRVQAAMKVCGTAVFLAILSNGVAVVSLRLTPSRVWHSVFYLITILTFIGLLHAMLLLPSLLALLRADGRGFSNWQTRQTTKQCHAKRPEDLEDLQSPALVEEGHAPAEKDIEAILAPPDDVRAPEKTQTLLNPEPQEEVGAAQDDNYLQGREKEVSVEERNQKEGRRKEVTVEKKDSETARETAKPQKSLAEEQRLTKEEVDRGEIHRPRPLQKFSPSCDEAIPDTDDF
mmetsp:Transcript_51755/g.101435  ORF Transcript_51755/g.101435 Transcript_51755/m.101435 type:complete len:274 (-) Transcript_51755:17-838(-)